MKKISIIVLLAFACKFTFAQTAENRKATFHFSFISPIGSNGKYAAEYTNDYSLNLLVGISKNERRLTLAGVSNIILHNAKAVQVAGLSNYIGNNGEGVQCAGVANINKGRFNGLQIAGLFNTAGNVRGMQVAGLVNIAKDVKGVQLSGLINIAENSDVPIGLINIIKNGEMGVAMTYDGIGNVMASFRSGGKYTYGILGVGYNHKIKKNVLVTEAGFGVHIPVVKWFRINNELKATAIGSNTDSESESESNKLVFNAGYSLLPAFRIGKHFELFGGVSINYMETKNMSAGDIFPKQSLWKGDNSAKLQQVYLGYQVGIQYIF